MTTLVGHTVGDAHGIVLAMDRAVFDLMHRSRDQAIGLSYLELTHPHDRSSNKHSLRRLRVDSAPTLIRKRYLRPDGSSVAVHIEVSCLSGVADGRRLIGTVRLASPGKNTSRPELLRIRALHAVELAKRRNVEFGNELAGDHAWIILLHLYLAEIECRIIDLDHICSIMDFSKAITTRWMQALKFKGLVDETRNDLSGEQLTASGFAAVERALGIDRIRYDDVGP